jgi:hypothetical protein
MSRMNVPHSKIKIDLENDTIEEKDYSIDDILEFVGVLTLEQANELT